MFLLFIRFFMLTRKMRPVHDPIYSNSPVRRTRISLSVYRDSVMRFFYYSCVINHVLRAPDTFFKAFWSCLENSRRYSLIMVHHRGTREAIYEKSLPESSDTDPHRKGHPFSCTLKTKCAELV